MAKQLVPSMAMSLPQSAFSESFYLLYGPSHMYHFMSVTMICPIPGTFKVGAIDKKAFLFLFSEKCKKHESRVNSNCGPTV